MKIGFIGVGNMGSAMVKGLMQQEHSPVVGVYDVDPSKLHALESIEGITIFKSIRELMHACDFIILGVKPQIYPLVLSTIKPFLEDQVIISVAAGIALKDMTTQLDYTKVVRTMPNTPALVQEGMSVVCPHDKISDAVIKEVCEIFSSFGRVKVVEEKYMDAVIAVSGSSPAYIYLLIEAMADAAVLGGISRDDAYFMAAQSVKGAAEMVLTTGLHPAVLKDQVCSPGGTTIEAVAKLEEKGFRHAVIESMVQCMKKSKNM